MNSKIVFSVVVILLVLTVVLLSLGNIRETSNPNQIGAIIPLTGGAANLGEWALRGATIAKNEINEDGGIKGMPLEIIVEDDQCDGKLALTAFEKLTSTNNISVIVGPLCNAAVLPVATPAKAKGIPIIAIGVTTESVRNSGEFTFTMLPPIESQTQKLAQFILDELSITSASIIYAEDEYGKENETTFKEHFEQLGGEITSSYSFQKTTTDFRSILLKIKNEPTESILIAGYSPNFINILKQIKEMGIQKKIISVSNIQDPKIIESIPAEIEGVYYTYPELSSENISYLKESYGEEDLPIYVVAGYEAVKQAAVAIAECKTDSLCIRNKLNASLKELPYKIIIKTIKDGKFLKYE